MVDFDFVRESRYRLAVIDNSKTKSIQKILKKSLWILRKRSVFFLIAPSFAAAAVGWLHHEYRLPIDVAPVRIVRLAGSKVLSKVYSDDLSIVNEIMSSYNVGTQPKLLLKSGPKWENLQGCVPGIKFFPQHTKVPKDVPFIYEDIDNPDLARFRERYNLTRFVENSPDEYSAMLELFNWIGQQWDYGEDLPPGGYDNFRPVDLMEAVAQGGRFWCEVDAKFTVYAAIALGWPARLVTLSRDGYNWEHAVAEIWSNQFEKWFVVDSNYNLIYESNGVLLSAFELCHSGLELQKNNLLIVKPVAPPKPSVLQIDLIPFYAYVHFDLRNDWLTRDLRKGSPAGGNLSTWWTSRPELQRLLTVSTRIDDQEIFDWPVNVACVTPHGLADIASDTLQLTLSLGGYSPYFSSFQWATDGGGWQAFPDSTVQIPIIPGRHQLQFRMVTASGWTGPSTRLGYEWIPE